MSFLTPRLGRLAVIDRARATDRFSTPRGDGDGLPRHRRRRRSTRGLFATLATVAGLTLAPAPADAEIRWQTRISGNGAYGIVHFGAVGNRRYIQIYVHDTQPDNRCAEIWADFATQGIQGRHRHENPVRAIICGHGRKGWSERYYIPYRTARGYVTGIRWVDACWRTQNARDCVREIADNNRAIAEGDDMETVRVRPVG
jgi:hypothetical protein